VATTSRVPSAVDALISLCRAAFAPEAVRVVDGPPGNDLTDTDMVFVGWQPEADFAATLIQDFNATGARTRDESFTILCYAESRAGGTDIKARRDRAFALVAGVEQGLRATDVSPGAPTLNGTVMWAHLTTGNLRQYQSDSGALVGVEFAIACRARI
jgi:hypothetical protein